jgi:hypothetical protein
MHSGNTDRMHRHFTAEGTGIVGGALGAGRVRAFVVRQARLQ